MKWPSKILGGGAAGTWFNQLLESARSCQIKPGRGYRVNQTSDGTTIELINTGGGGAGANVAQFKIQSDGGNVWVCRTWDGTTLGSVDVNINKPYQLLCGVGAITSRTIRGTTYSFSYSNSLGYYVRTATFAGNVVERSCIVPDPLNGDIILAVYDGSLWWDLNTDGRTWAEM